MLITKKNNILVLGEDFVQGINGTTIYVEKMYSINFTENNEKFVLSLHYNGDNSYLSVKWKGYNSSFNSRIDKKDVIK